MLRQRGKQTRQQVKAKRVKATLTVMRGMRLDSGEILTGVPVTVSATG